YYLLVSLNRPIYSQYYYSFKSYYFPMSKEKKLSYTCTAGYTTESGSQDARITCTATGWLPAPKCYSKSLTFIAVTEDKMYYTGDTIRYRCDLGYSINGSNEITCKMGKWTSPPKCIETWETCPSPPAIKNGASFRPLLTNYTAGSSIKYRCHRYHVLEGPETVHCVQGKWTAQPTCLEPCTLNMDDMSNNNIEMKWRLEGELFFLHGDTIDFVCKQGYYLSSSSRQSQLKVQCTRGKLRYPTCIMKGKTGICFCNPIITHQVQTH
uniref:Coagulation factor XIII B chain n=1 Tax=Gopherus evgoodei TaxID=1825980 RepID=A0A8C4W8J0_9SAUR